MKLFAVPILVALMAVPAAADHHNSPLGKYMNLFGGEAIGQWRMGPAQGTMFMENEWAADHKATESSWRLEIEGETVASGTGLAFWNPEEERIEEVSVDSAGTVTHSHLMEKEEGVWTSKVIKMVGGQGNLSSDMQFISNYNERTFVILTADSSEVMRIENIRKVDEDDDDEDDGDDDDGDDDN